MVRFSKVFQLLSVVLVIAVINVYVMAAPVRSTDPKKADAPEITEANAEVARAEIATTNIVTPVAVAAEKLPLAPNAKINFNRIFSKSEITSHAAGNPTFLNAKATSRSVFKAPPRTGTVPQDPDNDSGGGGSKGTWIAVGVIAAVLTIAVIGLRHDRGIESVQPH